MFIFQKLWKNLKLIQKSNFWGLKLPNLCFNEFKEKIKKEIKTETKEVIIEEVFLDLDRFKEEVEDIGDLDLLQYRVEEIKEDQCQLRVIE